MLVLLRDSLLVLSAMTKRDQKYGKGLLEITTNIISKFPESKHIFSKNTITALDLLGGSRQLLHSVHVPTDWHCNRGQYRKNLLALYRANIVQSKSGFSSTKLQFLPFLSDSKHSNLSQFGSFVWFNSEFIKLYQVEIFLRSLSMVSIPYASDRTTKLTNNKLVYKTCDVNSHKDRPSK